MGIFFRRTVEPGATCHAPCSLNDFGFLPRHSVAKFCSSSHARASVRRKPFLWGAFPFSYLGRVEWVYDCGACDANVSIVCELGDPHSEAICARTVRLGEWCHFNSCIACSSHERLSGSSLQVTTYSQRAKDALEKSHPGAADAEVAQ